MGDIPCNNCGVKFSDYQRQAKIIKILEDVVDWYSLNGSDYNIQYKADKALERIKEIRNE